MSPGSGVQSEYMKRYREPRWDQYAPCYRELRRYRLGRRLLEQAHAPWLWDAWGPDGASEGTASPGAAPRCAPAGSPEPPAPAEPAPEGPGREPGARAGDAEAADGEQDEAPPEALPVQGVGEEPKHHTRMDRSDRSPSGIKTNVRPWQQPSVLFSRGSRKAVRSPQRPSSKGKENKHPFALYGWGERQTNTGSQKTHNVCASAPVHEIHESALRAKSRRQVEKRRLAAQRQRAHSVDMEKSRRSKASAASSADSPWVTEYMRCYSARA